MAAYQVLVGFDCNVSVDVEADDPQAAMEAAQEQADASLCHHCSRKVNLNDPTYAIVIDEEAGKEVLTEGTDGDLREATRAATFAEVIKALSRHSAARNIVQGLAKKGRQ